MGISLRIAVLGRKGGVGKSSIAASLASIYASSGQSVLLLDLDPQANAAFALGVDLAAAGTASLLLGDHPAPQRVPGEAPLHVLPGGPSLADHRVQLLDPEHLGDELQSYTHDIAIFDCPPGNEHLERQAVAAANVAVIVLDAHPFALVGALRVWESIGLRRDRGRSAPERVALAMSRVDLRRAADRQLGETLHETLPGLPRFAIRQDVAIASATADQLPVMIACPQARAVEDMRKLAEYCRG